MTRRILVLFPDEWDRAAAHDPRYRGRFEFVHEGFDLFSFPDNARLFTFDALAFAEELARRHADKAPRAPARRQGHRRGRDLRRAVRPVPRGTRGRAAGAAAHAPRRDPHAAAQV